jgi:gliding motility-associated-like protein
LFVWFESEYLQKKIRIEVKSGLYIAGIGLALMLFGVTVQAQYQSVVCAGDTGIAYYVQGWENSSFEWTVEGGSISREFGDSIIVNWPEEPGEYSISVREISEQGCAGELKSAIVLVSGVNVDLGDDAGICDGELFELEVDEDLGSVLWHDGSTLPVYSTVDEGWIRVEITNDYACSTSDSLYLSVYEVPLVDLGPDTSVCVEEGLVLDAGTDGDFYRWSTGAVSQQITVYEDGNQMIWVELENSYGCLGSDTILIADCGNRYLIDPPTAITPNGDGVNDVWNIYALQQFDQAEVDIFDQWGTLVWRSDPGYSQSWDGTTMKGRPVPVDSYHFVIRFNDGSDEMFVGYVTVIR